MNPEASKPLFLMSLRISHAPSFLRLKNNPQKTKLRAGFQWRSMSEPFSNKKKWWVFNRIGLLRLRSFCCRRLLGRLGFLRFLRFLRLLRFFLLGLGRFSCALKLLFTPDREVLTASGGYFRWWHIMKYPSNIRLVVSHLITSVEVDQLKWYRIESQGKKTTLDVPWTLPPAPPNQLSLWWSPAHGHHGSGGTASAA